MGRDPVVRLAEREEQIGIAIDWFIQKIVIASNNDVGLRVRLCACALIERASCQIFKGQSVGRARVGNVISGA